MRRRTVMRFMYSTCPSRSVQRRRAPGETRCDVDRRLCLTALLIVGGMSIAAAAVLQTPKPGAVPIPEVQKVRENLYVIGGGDPRDQKTFSGGNTGIFIQERGVVIVDTKFPGWGKVILEKVQSLTNKPVTTIINTHTHFDHAGSNAEFPATVDFVAHENTKKYMMQRDCPPVTTCLTGANEKYLPKQTFKDKLTLFSGKDQVDLYYFGPGHTNGDSFIVYTALRTVQTGDMFAWKDAPFIDRSNGGSGVEWPKTLTKMLAGIKNVDTVIPGHHPVSTLRDLEEYQRFNADLLSATQAAIKSGKTVDEAAASIDLTTKYKGYKSERTKAAIQAIYDELKK